MSATLYYTQENFHIATTVVVGLEASVTAVAVIEAEAATIGEHKQPLLRP